MKNAPMLQPRAGREPRPISIPPARAQTQSSPLGILNLYSLLSRAMTIAPKMIPTDIQSAGLRQGSGRPLLTPKKMLSRMFQPNFSRIHPPSWPSWLVMYQ